VSDELRALGAFGAAVVLALVFVPLARRIALRTGFLDRPVDYKAHASATPYLGGAAVVAAFSIAGAAFGSAAPRFGTVLAVALLLAAMGTIDDRRTLGPGLRFGAQLLAGVALWLADIRWDVAGTTWIDLPLTMIWVAGLANAFNLLDNIDGATATTAAVSAAGIGLLAASADDAAIAALAFALSGACAGFLPFNLSSPARIFLGDGGSVPVGFLVAALAMEATASGGGEAILIAVPLAGVAIFDTSLVVLSRTRRGIAVLTGGRDHVTHRLLSFLRTPRRVAAVLAVVQALLCALTLAIRDSSDETVLLVAVAYLAVGGALLAFFERPAFAGPPKEQAT
jgi:UDP-GlcNAc:undecaprenyl-phosphate GlcNAc-1-phosphate transferase